MSRDIVGMLWCWVLERTQSDQKTSQTKNGESLVYEMATNENGKNPVRDGDTERGQRQRRRGRTKAEMATPRAETLREAEGRDVEGRDAEGR